MSWVRLGYVGFASVWFCSASEYHQSLTPTRLTVLKKYVKELGSTNQTPLPQGTVREKAQVSLPRVVRRRLREGIQD